VIVIMNLMHQSLEGVSRWIDSVATTLLALKARISPMRSVELIEDAAGVLTLQSQPQHSSAGQEPRSLQIADGRVLGATPELIATLSGCRLAMLLQPTRFVFRALQLPRQAGEFLDDIVRAQIDRVTPWSAEAAVFGCGPPSNIGNDRMVVTVAATAREMLAPLLAAVSNLRPAAVAVFACAEGDDPATGSIKVLEERVPGARDVGAVRRLLSIILAVGVLAACTATASGWIVDGALEAQRSEVTRRLAELRVAKQAGQIASKEEVALASLETRKNQVAPSVIVLEALSQLLPDHTYVTELRIVGDKLQLIGVTRDAPSLIRLIEQSQRFTRATFFAPTTRAPSDPGEHFHIEARIEPVLTASK
jgi:general secretion pathway protein L